MIFVFFEQFIQRRPTYTQFSRNRHFRSLACHVLPLFVRLVRKPYLYDRPVSLTKREEWTVFLQDNLPEKTAKEFGPVTAMTM